MKKKTILKLAGLVVFTAWSVMGFSQDDLGVACGCPPVSARTTTVNLSTYVVNGLIDPQLSADLHLTCDKIWVLDQKIYVPKGKTLTIDPGTVIKGTPTPVGDPSNAAALIIERGGKIIANGTQSCPIVFTAQDDPMDGSYSLTNVGKWGGVVFLGLASNNLLKETGNSGNQAIHDGIGFIEGFSSANSWNHYGAGPLDPDPDFQVPNDDDNSGIFRYVSVRHAGAILGTGSGNELNGISLGSVGRGTTFEHVEIVSSADDGIEFFGGTVNVKYVSCLFGDDDNFDWDQNWRGKGQFLFTINADSMNTGNLHTCDNGFEMDADDGKSATSSQGHSHPIIYNATMISNGHLTPSADNTGPAAIQAKELTGGEIYNSIFANYRSGLHLATSRSNATNKGDAYDQWTNNSADAWLTTNGGVAYFEDLKVKHNTFINCGQKNARGNTFNYPLSTGTMTSGKNATIKEVPFTAPSEADTVQFFTTDGNVAVASVPGIDFIIGFSADNSVMTDPYHMTPFSNLATPMTPPVDGFFSPVNFQGAFDATKGDNWLSGWAQNQVLSIQNTNPTDLNGDGITDVNDFLIFSPKFGTKSK